MEVKLHNLPSIHNANNAASSSTADNNRRGMNHASIDIIYTVRQRDGMEEFHGQKSSQLFSFKKRKRRRKFWKHVDLTWLLKKFQHFSKKFVLHRNFYLSLNISMVTTWLTTETRISTEKEYLVRYWWPVGSRLPNYLSRFSQLGNHLFPKLQILGID